MCGVHTWSKVTHRIQIPGQYWGSMLDSLAPWLTREKAWSVCSSILKKPLWIPIVWVSFCCQNLFSTLNQWQTSRSAVSLLDLAEPLKGITRDPHLRLPSPSAHERRTMTNFWVEKLVVMGQSLRSKPEKLQQRKRYRWCIAILGMGWVWRS